MGSGLAMEVLNMAQQQDLFASKSVVPCPERIRRIGKSGFGWLDARLFRDGWFRVMSAQEVALYTFLCLVADRRGMSWYRRERLGKLLGLEESEVGQVLNRLCDLDLVAFRPFYARATDGFYQVLSLPSDGPGGSAGQ